MTILVVYVLDVHPVPCGSPRWTNQERTMATSTQEEENKELVRRFHQALDDHELDRVDEFLAENYTTGIYRSGTEEEIGGRDGMKELWEEYLVAFPDLTGEFTELIAEGDRVAYFRADSGTHEGEFRGIEPTGNEITFEYAGYYIIEDGEIVHGNALGNIMSLLKQMDVDLPLAT